MTQSLFAKFLAIFSFLLYRRTVAVLSGLLLVGAIATLTNIQQLSANLIETQAKQNAVLYAEALQNARTLYSSDAVNRVQEIEGVTVTHDYTTIEGGMPIPATFLMELSERIRDSNSGVLVRLFSDYPFEWRKQTGGPQDEYEVEALDHLRQYPNTPYTKIESVGGRRSYRYAQAEIMRPSCVGCHNSHPESPKRDWAVGDVRGVLEIVQPLDTIQAQVDRGLKETSATMGTVLVIAMVGLGLVVTRLRNTSKELERRVLERTAQLQTSHEQLAAEREKSERLLLNVLPASIATRLKDNPGTFAQGFGNVTILFADICGFTQLSSRVSPEQLVEWLNDIFSRFDRLTEEYGLEKIKTIGDAYMVVGGVPNQLPNHAAAVADLALAMQREIACFDTFAGVRIQVRIGINTGSVVAGVIGLRKFAYDLWGDAVNVASRMESSGKPGWIQVSPSTYEMLRGEYVFERRGSIEIKGKGKMTTFWLLGKMGSRSSSTLNLSLGDEPTAPSAREID